MPPLGICMPPPLGIWDIIGPMVGLVTPTAAALLGHSSTRRFGVPGGGPGGQL
jgi:hypothetical protein